MSDDEELYIARPHSFFGVYILYNINPKFKGSIYIGFTVNPERRIRQHNREIKGGAWKTGRNRGPWHMVLITHGFNTKLAALQFEWAWQNPKKSRRLNHLPGKQTKENAFTYRLRVLSEMLNTGPWNRLSLTIQWLKQEYFEHFPVSRPPPTYMPIAYGAIRTVNKRKSDGVQSRRQLFNAEDEVKICRICSEPDYKIDENPMLHCIVDVCQFVSHMTCLATTFLQQMKHDGKYLIPVSGTCPSCREEVLWSDVIKQKKYSLTPGAECTVDFRDSQEEDIHDTQEEGSSEDFDDDDDFD